jgi:hypothetical protein
MYFRYKVHVSILVGTEREQEGLGMRYLLNVRFSAWLIAFEIKADIVGTQHLSASSPPRSNER